MGLHEHMRGRIAERLRDSFTRESRSSIRQATIVRMVALVAIALWLIKIIEYPQVLFFHVLLALFALLGLGHDFFARRLAPAIWPSALFILADSCLLAYTLSTLNPLEVSPPPAQVILRQGNFQFFYILLAASVLTCSPRLVLWCGVTGAAAWSAAVAWIVYLPDTLTPGRMLGWDAFDMLGRVPLLLLPNFVNTTMHFTEIFIFVVVTGVLATVVWRIRRLALRQASVERERANLSRHFSPNMVDTLALSDEPLGEVRKQKVAVLFADIVGFSGLAEQLGPDRTMELLRRVHSLTAEEIFAHNGTLDKYIGDAVMATFGVPAVGPDDAANAIACAIAIRDRLARDNPLRAGPLRIGIGAHFGEVVMGDMGGESRLEFGVIGDTVNVASRLEGLTRELNNTIVFSNDLVTAANAAGSLTNGFHQIPGQQLRGRNEPIAIWAENHEG